ncbi:MAG: T9SS type A sorting domain-containing protein [Bacteroidetes bacterium]|nr:T9SS type A sorting domain-containing protein [Bacteroidota bacterium]
MKRLILILSLITIVFSAHTQSTLIWSNDYQTGLSYYYTNHPSITYNNDTIIVTGRKSTINGQRLLIVKYMLSGDTVSAITYGKDSVNNNIIIDYKFDNLAHVYILNNEKLGFYKSKIVLQKYDLNANLIWVKQIQSFADTSFSPHSFALINDSCLFITAYKEYDYPNPGDDVIFTKTSPYLYAFNTNGIQLWERRFLPNADISWFSSDIFAYNNTAFLFGNINSSANCLEKVDIYNNVIINNNTGIQNGINNVQMTADNNLLISGFTQYRITKINLNGTVIWTQYYGTNLPANVTGDEVVSTIQDVNGDIYLTGRHYGENYGTSAYTNADILTLKYNSNGNLIWQNRYKYGIDNADIGNCITLKNGNIYVGGQSERNGVPSDYDYVVLKIDADSGTTKGIYRYNGIENGDDVVSSLKVFNNGNVVLTGLSSFNSKYDWTTQLLSDVILTVSDINKKNDIQIYPNPAKDKLNINLEKFSDFRKTTLSIYNIQGQLILQKIVNQAVTEIDISHLAKGMYFIKIDNDSNLMLNKFVKE